MLYTMHFNVFKYNMVFEIYPYYFQCKESYIVDAIVVPLDCMQSYDRTLHDLLFKNIMKHPCS